MALSSLRVTQPSKKGQQTLQQCVDRSKKYSTSSSEHKRLTKAVTHFITRCAYAQGRVKRLSPSIYLFVCVSSKNTAVCCLTA